MHPGIEKFRIDEIIIGKGMDVRVVDLEKTTGRIVAEVILVLIAPCRVSPGQLLVFLPQEAISYSWVAHTRVAHTRKRQSFVLCLRADGRKILG